MFQSLATNHALKSAAIQIGPTKLLFCPRVIILPSGWNLPSLDFSLRKKLFLSIFGKGVDQNIRRWDDGTWAKWGYFARDQTKDTKLFRCVFY